VARLFSRLIAAGLILFGIALFLYLIPSDKYVLLPDRAQPVAPYVTVKGERNDNDGGGIYYVAVEVKKASVLEKLFHGLHQGATLVPATEIVSRGQSDQQHRREELHAMAESQQIGAAVALRALGYHLNVRSTGAVIAAVAGDAPASGKLKPRDIVVSVDGRRVVTPNDLRSLIRRHRPGETVRLTVRSQDKVRKVAIKTIADPHDPARPLIGVITDCSLETATTIKLPVPVRINLGQVGGPSAGLAFALDLFEELGHDVDHGHKVAATGQLCIDGTVVPVGGLKQKTIGAREAGIDVFLVPVGENARDARRYAGRMRVIPVDSFQQALRVLATLPRKGPKT
jgi:PDZ domain-containing protein